MLSKLTFREGDEKVQPGKGDGKSASVWDAKVKKDSRHSVQTC